MQNFEDIQELQKQYYTKNVKSRSYIPNNKVWLNNKYIKTKYNYKLKSKFISLLWILYLVKIKAYKIKLLKK